MPTDAKPLFRSDALRPKLNTFALSSNATSARPKLANGTDLLASKPAEKMKETELLADFLRDVFGDLIGYVGPASGAPVYTLKRESLVQVRAGSVSDGGAEPDPSLTNASGSKDQYPTINP